MTDINGKFVFKDREPESVDELLDEFVKSEYGIAQTDNGWVREDYDHDAYISLLNWFYEEHVPNGNWNIFINAWWEFWEYSYEDSINYLNDGGEIEYLVCRARKFIYNVWDAGLKKEDNDD